MPRSALIFLSLSNPWTSAANTEDLTAVTHHPTPTERSNPDAVRLREAGLADYQQGRLADAAVHYKELTELLWSDQETRRKVKSDHVSTERAKPPKANPVAPSYRANANFDRAPVELPTAPNQAHAKTSADGVLHSLGQHLYKGQNADRDHLMDHLTAPPSKSALRAAKTPASQTSAADAELKALRTRAKAAATRAPSALAGEPPATERANGAKSTTAPRGKPFRSGLPPYALVLSGAVSRVANRTMEQSKLFYRSIYNLREPTTTGDGYVSPSSEALGAFVPLRLSAASLRRHVIEHNGGAALWDVFAHSWNPELAADIRRYFSPFDAKFEENGPVELRERPLYSEGAQWSQISWAISRSRAIGLMQRQAIRRGAVYERVVFMRYDVLLVKDFTLASMPTSTRIVSVGHISGDLHFVAQPSGSDCVDAFMRLPELIKTSKDPIVRNTVTGDIIPRALRLGGCQCKNDDVQQWVDEEVLRKVPMGLIACRGLDKLRSDYGLRPDEWASLRLECCDGGDSCTGSRAAAKIKVVGRCPCGCTPPALEKGLCRKLDDPVWLQ